MSAAAAAAPVPTAAPAAAPSAEEVKRAAEAKAEIEEKHAIERIKEEVKRWDSVTRPPSTVGNFEIVSDDIDIKHAKPQLTIVVARGRNLLDLDVGDYSDPFVKVELVGADGKVHATHRSHVIKNTLNPDWWFSCDDTAHLTAADHEWIRTAKLRVELWDDDVGKNDFMGYYSWDFSSIDGKIVTGEFALLLDEAKSGAKAKKNKGKLGTVWVKIHYRSPYNTEAGRAAAAAAAAAAPAKAAAAPAAAAAAPAAAPAKAAP